MVELAGIDQVGALLPTKIDAVELVAVECEPGDRQRLPLGACLFHPIVAAPELISAVAGLGEDTLAAGLAGVLVHLASIDLEALAELDVRIGDELFENGLSHNSEASYE